MSNYSLKQSLGYLTNKTNSLFKILLNREFKIAGFNLTSEHWSILAITSNNPESTQSAIADKALRDKTNVTRIIDSLQKQNLVERKPDKTDRRAHRISITTKGTETISKLIPIVIKANDIAEKGIDKKELEITNKVLNQVLQNLIPEI